jgi:BirA family transcriptional regulator, biotin operon repressor / biotin---[acetyl-CoA-carboxylase] ligase
MQSAAGIRLIAYDAVGSTNAEAFALARGGLREAVWITARQQTAGRGRRGRAWASPPGNLYASQLLIDPCGGQIAPQLSFVAALALHDAVAVAAPALAGRLTLKWPNDLLLDGAKVAGILVEGELLADGTFVSVIGIGVNCAHHPEDVPYRATSFAHADEPIAPEVLFEALSRATAARLAAWDRGAGFAAVREHWLALAWRLGEDIRLRTPEETAGRFAGIDQDGRLLIDIAGEGVRAIAAGEIAARAAS